MKMKNKRVVGGKFQMEQFSVDTILHVCFRSKIDTRKISTDIGRIFLYLAYRGKFPKTRIIVNGCCVPRKVSLLQVKLNLVSSITHFVYELPRNLPNNLRLKILVNWEIKIGLRHRLDSSLHLKN